MLYVRDIALFPLYRRRRLRGYVVANAVYALHLVYDLVGDFRHEVVRQVGPVGRHGVGAGNGAQGYGVLVGALVAHYADAADSGEEHGAGLPNLVVERLAVFANVVVHVLDIYVVGVLQYAHFLARYVAEYAYGQAGAGEWVALDEAFGHAELVTYAAHLVLEEPLERLAQLQVHLLGQSAYVVVALDDHARNAEALYAVGVYRALGEPFGVSYLLCLGVEHFYEVAAYYLALLLWVAHSFQVLEELVAGVYADDVEAEALVCVHYLLELVLAQHAVVDEDARKIGTYGAVEQRGAHGRVDAAAEAEDHAVVAELLFQLFHGSFYERRRAPLLLTAADVDYEVLKEQPALLRMEHFRVELHGPKRLLGAGIGGELNVGR